MKKDRDIFLPDTTVKLSSLKRVLNEVYELDIIELNKMDKKKQGGTLNSSVISFTQDDYNRLMDSGLFSSSKDVRIFTIFPKNGGRHLAKYNPDKQYIFVIGKKDLSNPIVVWLSENSYLGSDEQYKLEDGGTIDNQMENKLWNEIADGTPHSFKYGGRAPKGSYTWAKHKSLKAKPLPYKYTLVDENGDKLKYSYDLKTMASVNSYLNFLTRENRGYMRTPRKIFLFDIEKKSVVTTYNWVDKTSESGKNIGYFSTMYYGGGDIEGYENYVVEFKKGSETRRIGILAHSQQEAVSKAKKMIGKGYSTQGVFKYGLGGTLIFLGLGVAGIMAYNSSKNQAPEDEYKVKLYKKGTLQDTLIFNGSYVNKATEDYKKLGYVVRVAKIKTMAEGGGVSERTETQENNFGISYKLGDKFTLGRRFGNKDVEVSIIKIMPSGLFFKVDKSTNLFSIKTLHSKGSTLTSGEYLVPISNLQNPKTYSTGGGVESEKRYEWRKGIGGYSVDKYEFGKWTFVMKFRTKQKAIDYINKNSNKYANGGGVADDKKWSGFVRYRIEKWIPSKGYVAENFESKKYHTIAKDSYEAKNNIQDKFLNDTDYKDVMDYRYWWNGVVLDYANGGGIGGTSDSAEMDAPTLGGTMSSSMFEGDTSNKFKKGGSLFGRKDKKFTFVGEDGKVQGVNYRLVGITENGDKETISEHVSQTGAERKAKQWVKTASPKFKGWEINAFKFKDGGNCGCKEKYYLSSHKEMFDDNAKTITKKDIVDFIIISKNSDKKYWVKDINTKYSYYIYKGNLRLNNGTGGIFSTSITSSDTLKDEHKFKIKEEDLYDWEKELEKDMLKRADTSYKKPMWETIVDKFNDVYFLEGSLISNYKENELSSSEVKARGSNPYSSYEFRNFSPLLSWKEAEDKFKKSLTADELNSIEISYKKEEYGDWEEHDTEKYHIQIFVKLKKYANGGNTTGGFNYTIGGL